MAILNLTWNSPDTGSGGSPDVYKIYRVEGSNIPASQIFDSNKPEDNLVASVAFGTNSFSDTAVTAAKAYSYTVVAQNEAGYGTPSTSNSKTA